MKQKIAICLIFAMLLTLLCACNENQPGTQMSAEYTGAATEQGSVIRLDYESEDYVRDGSPITKTAYVYTPYGYNEADAETRYNILYIRH